MKTNRIFFVSCITAMLGCTQPSDSPCMNGGGQQLKGKYLGTIYTSDSSEEWLGEDTLGTGTFINTNGFAMNFRSGGIQKNETELEVNTSYVSDDCGFINYVSDYVRIEQKTHKFVATNLNFFYGYERRASYSQDTALWETNRDIFGVNLNGTIFYLPFNNSGAARWEKHDSVTLGSKIEYDVYRVYLDTGGQKPNIIVPAGIYYTAKKGLIAFYFSNGEFWVK